MKQWIRCHYKDKGSICYVESELLKSDDEFFYTEAFKIPRKQVMRFEFFYKNDEKKES